MATCLSWVQLPLPVNRQRGNALNLRLLSHIKSRSKLLRSLPEAWLSLSKLTRTMAGLTKWVLRDARCHQSSADDPLARMSSRPCQKCSRKCGLYCNAIATAVWSLVQAIQTIPDETFSVEIVKHGGGIPIRRNLWFLHRLIAIYLPDGKLFLPSPGLIAFEAHNGSPSGENLNSPSGQQRAAKFGRGLPTCTFINKICTSYQQE